LRADRVVGPVRTCIGCRTRDDAGNLVRIVTQGDSYVVDRGRGLPGRGAHIHPRPECLDRAEQRRALARALRVPGTYSLDALRNEVLDVSPAPGARRT